MSKASDLISGSIIRKDYKTIFIGGKTYKAYAPTIKDICNAIHSFNEVDFEYKNYLEIASSFNTIKDSFLSGLYYLFEGKDDYPKELEEITIDELNEALKVCFSMIDNSDFQICNFEEERSDPESKVEIIGNKTLLGQIATFIDTLHLSYKEVTEEIPYRNLLIMQKDKLHQVYGQKVNRMSGKEMMERRNKRQR